MAYQQIKIDNNGTYGGYDPNTGQAFAAPDLPTFQKYFGAGATPDPKAPLASFDTAKLTGLNAGNVVNVGATGGSDYGSLSQSDIQGVYDSLGLSDAEKAAYGAPSESTTQIYNDAYNQAGLGDLKSQITDLGKQITSRKSDLATATGKINENPWLDEASRLGKTRNLTDEANAEIKNLIDEQTQYQSLYDQGVNEVNGLVTRTNQDYQNNKAMAQAHLQYLEQKATADLNALSTEKANRYQAQLGENAAPKTISGPDGSQYAWDPSSKTFVQVVAGKSTGNPSGLSDTPPQSLINSAYTNLHAASGKDGAVSPDDWNTALSQWMGAGYSVESFVKQFKAFSASDQESGYGSPASAYQGIS